MKNVFKNVLISAGLILALLSVFSGSYLPIVKARSYIRAINMLSSVKDVPEFENVFGKALDIFSPVGQEEVVKFLSSDIVRGIVSQNNPEAVSREIVSFIEPYLFKNDVRHLITRGNLYNLLWQKYGHIEDFAKTEEAYRAALAIGPKLPPVLYSLLDLYQAKGDFGKEKEIGNIILGYWPNDQNVRNIVDKLK